MSEIAGLPSERSYQLKEGVDAAKLLKSLHEFDGTIHTSSITEGFLKVEFTDMVSHHELVRLEKFLGAHLKASSVAKE
jgi:hypothetical protein